jgi:hypothetical protein
MIVGFCAASAIALGFAPVCAGQSYAGPGFAIPDPGTASSTIVITDDGILNAGFIVAISFSPEHTWAGDLIATLTHDDGSTTVSADLFRRIGKVSATIGLGNGNDLNGTYQFSDSFSTSLWNAPASIGNLVPGEYRAVTNLFDGQPGPLVNLDAVFAGRALAGTWTLAVEDAGSGDDGSIAGWAITIPGPPTLMLAFAAFAVTHGRRRRKR